MTILAEMSDAELEAEVERRRRRKAAAEHDKLLREFAHAMCMDTQDKLHDVFEARLRGVLGDDYAKFLSHPERFIVNVTAAYIGSR